MAIDLLVQPRAAFEHLQALRLRDARAIVIDPQLVTLGGWRDAQAYLAVGPFAGVVQQVAEQLQQILAVPGQQQTGRHVALQQQAFAVDHPQRRQQPGQLCIAIELRAGQGIAGQARAVEFAGQALLDLLQLLAHLRADLEQRLQAFAGSQADKHRQRRLQGMTEVAQGIARTAQAVFGMGQQVVDLIHQRLQLAWDLGVQLRALALLQLSDLLARPLQRAQRAGHGETLQHQDQHQRHQPQAQADLLHAPKTLAYR